MFTSEELFSELKVIQSKKQELSLRTLFDTEPHRTKTLTFPACELIVDFSKSLIDTEILNALLKIPNECSMQAKIEAMYRGDRINLSEDRSVLHTALRAPASSHLEVDGIDIIPEIQNVLKRMEEIAQQLSESTWLGVTGKPIQTVVNIGIGGSDLGPTMAVNALKSIQYSNVKQYFVSNVDPTEIEQVLSKCAPETTLFIIASKTFTTTETMLNANIAKAWLQSNVPAHADFAPHFVALSVNIERATAFGVAQHNILGFWDWVGGRFSLPSAIGLSLMIQIGPKSFREFLDGMHQMDMYFKETPTKQNAIVIYSLIGIWYRNFLDFSSYAVLPYDANLSRFPAYLQQLIMESNGKRVDSSGKQIEYETSFVIWGEPGTNGQHSFHQLLHQGTDVVPVDFLIPAKSATGHTHSHDVLIANALAQAKVLAFGSEDEQDPQKFMPGNRPSISILYKHLSPFVLGQLIAFYEHVVFTQGVIWNINSFDQWGVELGKKVATSLLPVVEGKASAQVADEVLIRNLHALKSNRD